MVKRGLVIVLMLLFVLLPATVAEQSPADENDCVFYFYGVGCEHCVDVEDHLSDLQRQYPQLNLQRYEVYGDRDNFRLLERYFDSFNVPEESRGVPIAFVTNTYYAGPTSITSLLEERIKNNDETDCPAVTPGTAAVGIAGETSTEDVFETLTFSKVTKAALGDAYEQGALALLIVLLLMIVSVRDNDQMLKKGIVFVIAIYLTYFLFGIGFLTYFYGSKFGFFLAKAIGLVAVAFAFLSVKGFFSTWRIWFKHNFEDMKELFQKIIDVFVSPVSVLVIGFLTALMTLPDVGHLFLSMRALLGDNITSWQVWPLMLYYIFVFILHPLAVILFLYFARQRMKEMAARKAEDANMKVETWQRHIRKVINFIISIVLFVLGLVVIFM
jgi:hypothetical protein